MISRLFGVAMLSTALLGTAVASAQAPPGSPMPMGGQSGSMTGPATPGMMGQGGMMMGGMCPMMGGSMGGMMGMGMMGPGMMAGAQDPKAVGRMLQMRAEMMRAMADVLAKHGKALEEGK